jgi:hypothetical protein
MLFFAAAVSSLLFTAVNAHAFNGTRLSARDLTQEAQLDGLKFDIPALPNPGRNVLTIEGIPEDCAAYLGDGKECSTTMQAADVFFDDCTSRSFRVCHCDDANISMDESVDFLAHVPIGLRNHVGTVMVMPDTSAHAYTWPTSGEIHFFGVCSQRTWIHEVRSITYSHKCSRLIQIFEKATHAADGALGITADGDSSAWGQAVAADSCVPDNYARSNLVEVRPFGHLFIALV